MTQTPTKNTNSFLLFEERKRSGEMVRIWHTPNRTRAGGSYRAEVELEDGTLYHEGLHQSYIEAVKDAYKGAAHYYLKVKGR